MNIQDLVLVAGTFGQPGKRNSVQNPDVNRDGIINILDLVRVSNSFGKTEVNDTSTYHEIQDYIFDKSCANSACHAAPANAGNLNLTYGLSYQDLVGRVPQNPTAAAAGMKLIDPGNPENSFLLTKLMDPTPEQGVRMPFNAGELHSGKIEAIRTWIAAGAPQEGILDGIGDLSVLRDPLEVFEPPAPPELGTDTMHGEVYVNIHTIPPEEVEYEAKVLLVYNLDINVLPGTTRTTGYDWFIKDELERVGVSPDADMHVVVLSSHMHRHGELFEITRLSTKELLHRSISYDSAPITVFDPPLILDRADGLSFACTQSNYDKDDPIRFGFTSEDEMCVMYGYYYLSTEGTETEPEE